MKTADDFLVHYGVKGMKWGVRKDRGHEGERVKTKKLAKLDKQWEKENTGIRGYIKMHNAAADAMNRYHIEAINRKPEYNTPEAKKVLSDYSHPLTKKYHKEMEDAFNKEFTKAAVDLGTNPSGTKRYQIEVDPADGQEGVRLVPVEVKHGALEDNMPVYKVEVDANWKFKSVKPEDIQHDGRSDDFLEHYGVKGMKWGVRKERNPVEVSTKTAPGRKVKTSGGNNQSPHEDAIKAAIIRQQAKKSTTDSLSNKQLQELITRMNLENQYKNLNQNNVSKGKKLLRLLTGQVGDKEVNQLQDFANTQYTTRRKKPTGHNKPKIDFAVKAGLAGLKSAGGGGKKK